MNKRNIKFNHEVDIQIRFNDVDMLGHINNISIQEYFDLGRINYLSKTLGDFLDTGNNHLVIANYKTSFYSQILFDEQIKVSSKIYEIGNKSIKMIQTITNKSQKVIASNDCVLVGFNFKNHESIYIPKLWRTSLLEFENGDIIQDKVQ